MEYKIVSAPIRGPLPPGGLTFEQEINKAAEEDWRLVQALDGGQNSSPLAILNRTKK